jgi:hypothetical protein
MRPKTDGVYRIVHIDNLPDILERGMFAANHLDKPCNYHFIGHQRLTQQREVYPVPLPDGVIWETMCPFILAGFPLCCTTSIPGMGCQKSLKKK